MGRASHSIIPFALAIFLGLAACRPVPIQKPITAALPEARAALNALRTRAARIHGLQSMGRVTYFGDEGRIRLKAVLLAQRPTKFRIETLSVFEQPLQVMVSDGERLRLLADGQFYEGASTADNVARILPLPLSPSDLVDALLTGVPMDPDYRAHRIEWVEDSQTQHRLTLIADSVGPVVLDYDIATKTVRRLRLPARGTQPEVVILFEDFEPLASPAAFSLARRIKLKLSGADHEVTLKLRDVAANKGINPGLFSLSPPAGITPVDLDFAATSTTSTP